MATRKAVKTTQKASAAKTKVEAAPAVVQEKREYAPDDLINCRSLVNGGLYITGERTKMLYTFADYGDVTGVEYQDLVYMIRSQDKSIFEPRIIIEDEEIVSQFPRVAELYDSLYTVSDLKDIVNMSPAQMEKAIANLPKGAVVTLKGLISTMIDNHSLDSVTKIKALDKILGTNYFVVLAQN